MFCNFGAEGGVGDVWFIVYLFLYIWCRFGGVMGNRA